MCTLPAPCQGIPRISSRSRAVRHVTTLPSPGAPSAIVRARCVARSPPSRSPRLQRRSCARARALTRCDRGDGLPAPTRPSSPARSPASTAAAPWATASTDYPPPRPPPTSRASSRSRRTPTASPQRRLPHHHRAPRRRVAPRPRRERDPGASVFLTPVDGPALARARVPLRVTFRAANAPSRTPNLLAAVAPRRSPRGPARTYALVVTQRQHGRWRRPHALRRRVAARQRRRPRPRRRRRRATARRSPRSTPRASATSPASPSSAPGAPAASNDASPPA